MTDQTYPLDQALRFIDRGLPESSKRVTEMRKKFVRLLFEPNGYGASGIKDSERYKAYLAVVRMCNARSISNVKRNATPK